MTVYASGFPLKNMKNPGGEDQTRIRGGVGWDLVGGCFPWYPKDWVDRDPVSIHGRFFFLTNGGKIPITTLQVMVISN